MDKDNTYAVQSVAERAIYQLQTVKVAGKEYCLFFDSGCGDFVSKYQAVKSLGSKATQEVAGPIQIGGVGGIVSQSPHGIYTVKLPMHDGDEIQLSGVCLEQVTSIFPKYPIQGKVEDDIHKAYQLEGGDPDRLPKLPRSVGGTDVDFIIGIKYLRYHPAKVFELPSGLTIYRSIFKNADGGRGVIGGPHEVFSAIDTYFNLEHDHQSTFFNNQKELYRMGYQINPDVSLLGIKFKDPRLLNQEPVFHSGDEAYASHKQKIFEEAEYCGSEISYRCVRCRDCDDCKKHEKIEAVSIREEIEDDLIRKAVKIDVKNRVTTATLPFTHDPVLRLAPNKHKAMKTYQQQLRKLEKSPSDKQEVLMSEGKLQQLGYVDYVKNLSPDQQEMLRRSKIQNFIPWRVVWKENSISTPCRLVFDASQPTDTGYSLNDLLAKGSNNMNHLQEILMRWGIHKVGLTTDIKKMYNCVRLKETDWCYQRYLWNSSLNIGDPAEEKVIKTAIYGVRSSGPIAETGIRDTADICKEDYPRACQVIRKDVYVDDGITGDQSKTKAAELGDQLEIVLNHGGFSLKGIAYSGEDPPDSLSEDGVSICVAGFRWFTKEDQLSLNLGQLIFAQKQRGRKIEAVRDVPTKLTRRQCVSKVAEIFDILGKMTPITAMMKMDLHDLVRRKLDWDDVIPDDLRGVWLSHFEMMKEINNVRFNRAVIPEDAVSLDLETLDFGDASKSVACVAIYVRFKKKDGSNSCQLVFSRSRLVPDGMSPPRAELYAALLNTHSGNVVKRAFMQYHKGCTKFTDNQIALFWITNESLTLKQWVRNRVVEIRRFTTLDQWHYVESKDMIADKGTRRTSSLKDVDQESEWVNGFKWMKDPEDMFPMKTAKQISLDNAAMQEAKKEMSYQHDVNHCEVSTLDHNCLIVTRKIPDEVIERYKFSQYIIDPNRHRFQMVTRILAWVMRFIKHLKIRISGKNPIGNHAILSDEEIKKAEEYFFRAATKEVKHFMNQKQYQKMSHEKDGILMYTGRILPEQGVSAITPMSAVMKDLSSTTFCVPVIDKHSPIAYSIISDIHWYDKTVKHRGIESVWRYVLKYAYVFEGRDVVKKIKKSCQRCRYLEKKTIEIAMGPISKHNLTIAPAFYISQVDLAGHFKAYSPHNKRATVKIWLAVYVCATTSTTNIKVMEDYTTAAFIQSFVRLSCEVGYPKILLADSGSQIVKGAGTMKLNFKDLQDQLYRDSRVELELSPVGGHNVTGKVEKKIDAIKKSLEESISNERLSILQWETIAAEVANCINDLPLALGNNVGDFDFSDLITPNRLRLGRNNNRAPDGGMCVTNDSSRIIESNNQIFNCWFEAWLTAYVPKLITQPK